MKVVIKNCPDYQMGNIAAAINDGMAALAGIDETLAPGVKVLLKVNLLGPKPPESAAITHVEMVRGMVRYLHERGCIVSIGDSSGGAIAGISPTKRSFKISGILDMAAEEGAEIISFDQAGVQEIIPESGFVPVMYLAKPLFTADVVINMPKLKTHSSAIYTGAIKNLFGCIPGLKKAEFHKLAPDTAVFGEVLVDIHRAAPCAYHVLDGIVAMNGEGPTAGKPYNAGKILFSSDPLALDTVAMEMIGLSPEQTPIYKAARERNLGEHNLDKIEITGDYDYIPHLADFKLPSRVYKKNKRTSTMVVNVVDFFKTVPVVDLQKCRHCQTCVDSCPVQAIHPKSKVIDYQVCIECMCCHELCMYDAVKLRKVNFWARLMGKLFKFNA